MDHQINLKKYSIVFAITATLLLSSSSFSWALEANQQTWFNSITDSLATVGKTQQDKKDILRLRQDSRRQYRQQKDTLRKRSKTRKTIKKQQAEVMRKYNSDGHTHIGQ